MYRTTSREIGNADPSSNAPAMVFGVWNPLLAVALGWNAQAHQGFNTAMSEWQDFVRRRLEEDFALMQSIAHCRTPDQIWSAYAGFWQKAAEDYGKEIATLTKLITGVTSKMVTSAQSATHEAGPVEYPLKKAA